MMLTSDAGALYPVATGSIRGSSLRATARLLTAGVLAGPIYVAVGLPEALLRPGFDLRRHELSLLANGELGWIHVAMMVLTGLLAVAGALGLRRALTAGPGRTWGPVLIGLYGLGVAVAGLLTADPASGFPPGTPDGPAVVLSWHGIGHLVAGSVGFLGLIAGCFVFARRFRSEGRPRWAAYSEVTGILFLAAFVGIAFGSASATVNVAFGLAVVVAWAWVSALCARTRARLGPSSAMSPAPDSDFPLALISRKAGPSSTECSVRVDAPSNDGVRRGTVRFASIDDDIGSFHEDVRVILEAVRRTIREAAPEAKETLGYQIPTFALDGRDLVHVAAWKRHLAVYPTPAGDPYFAREIAPYRAARSSVRFPLDKPVPSDLIRGLVAVCLKRREESGE